MLMELALGTGSAVGVAELEVVGGVIVGAWGVVVGVGGVVAVVALAASEARE